MSDYDQKCVDLPMIHGRAVKMECLRPWSKPEYKNTISPWELSAQYKISYEDGAEVLIGCIFAYTLSQGSFWYFSDSKVAMVDSVFARDTRVLAYLARAGRFLEKEKTGLCPLLSEEDAERILAELEVPIEGLKYGSRMACENAERWFRGWHRSGLIEMNEEGHWVIKATIDRALTHETMELQK